MQPWDRSHLPPPTRAKLELQETGRELRLLFLANLARPSWQFRRARPL
jgi:hypothetical protein